MTEHQPAAVDVKRLRDRTGAGMMDAKRALAASAGDMDEAARWLREKGLARSEARLDRASTQGAVAVGTAGDVVALVELRSETDFVAKAPEFIALAQELADVLAARGEDVVGEQQHRVDDLKVALEENVAVGRVVRLAAGAGSVVGTYVHVQNGRGVNAVAVELRGGTAEQAHDVAVHVAFARPSHVRRDDFPAEMVAAKRAELERLSRNEGKPERALPKIVEGRLQGFFKEAPGGALLDQPFAKDDKRSVAQMLGDAAVVRFAQVEIGG